MKKSHHTSVFLRCFGLLLITGLWTIASAGNQKRQIPAYELDPSDVFTVSPQEIVEQCSLLLKKECTSTEKKRLLERRALAYFTIDDYKSALSDYDLLINDNPTCNVVWMRARALGALGKHSQAKDELEKLIMNFPDFAPGYASLAVVFGINGKLQKSLELANKAIKINPEYPGAYYVRAKVHFKLEDYQKTIEDITSYLAIRTIDNISPEEPYVIRGWALLNLGKNKEALQQFFAARRSNSKSLDARFGVWRAYFEMEFHGLAYTIIQQELIAEPENIRILIAFSKSCYAVGLLYHAFEAANKAHRIDRNDLDANIQLVEICYNLKKYDEAFKYLENALTLDPSNIQTKDHLAEYLSSCNDKKFRDGPRAKKIASELCDLTSRKDSRFLLLLANALAECGEFDSAIRTVKDARSLGNKPTRKEGDFETLIRLYQQKKVYRNP